jgi:hypothetical protein
MPRPKKVPSFSAALDCRDLELVKQYIDKNPKIVNAYIPSSRGYGTNPLRKVVTNEDIELIKLLLSYPTIDVNRTYVYTYFDVNIHFSWIILLSVYLSPSLMDRMILQKLHCLLLWKQGMWRLFLSF